MAGIDIKGLVKTYAIEGGTLRVLRGLNLALEEAVTNVILYAYPEGTSGDVLVDAAAGEKALYFTITDTGKAFDPTTKEDVDINAGIEDRPVGGLGIHLVRKIMDDVRYERIGGKNVLYLTKNY